MVDKSKLCRSIKAKCFLDCFAPMQKPKINLPTFSTKGASSSWFILSLASWSCVRIWDMRTKSRANIEKIVYQRDCSWPPTPIVMDAPLVVRKMTMGKRKEKENWKRESDKFYVFPSNLEVRSLITLIPPCLRQKENRIQHNNLLESTADLCPAMVRINVD